MGANWSLSANRTVVEESEVQSTSGAYRYPPKSGGPYFSNHFIMGGERFDSPRPESFLFGENSDLNFLGTKPAPFPYPPPQSSEPTKTLRCLINVRRDSLHFVPVPNQDLPPEEEQPKEGSDEDTPEEELGRKHRAADKKRFHIEFTFDSDVRCAITVAYFCTEEVTPTAATYTPSKPELKSETFYYKRGANQVFWQPTVVFQPGLHPDDELTFGHDDPSVIPVAIQCQALDGDAPRQSHTTLAVVERSSDGSTFVLKAVKQKLFVDGLSYLLQEIYGLENKVTPSSSKMQFDEDDADDCGADCVVCMSDVRDTIILPCRHLCLCNPCAESLRFQANNCPICRAPFIALLQIRAVQKVTHATHPDVAGNDQSMQDGIPPGYASVSLIDALNGPTAASLSAYRPDAPLDPVVVFSSDKAAKGKAGGRKRSSRIAASSSTSSQLSTASTAAGSAADVKPKSADTNVKVSMRIVNEVERNVDVVDEELANMAVAESLGDECESQEEKLGELEEDEEGEEAVVITLPIAAAHILAKDLPGTPGSDGSERSSQDSSSSSSASTKPLLAAELPAVHATSTIVNVVPTRGDEDCDGEADDML